MMSPSLNETDSWSEVCRQATGLEEPLEYLTSGLHGQCSGVLTPCRELIQLSFSVPRPESHPAYPLHDSIFQTEVLVSLFFLPEASCRLSIYPELFMIQRSTYLFKKISTLPYQLPRCNNCLDVHQWTSGCQNVHVCTVDYYSTLGKEIPR